MEHTTTKPLKGLLVPPPFNHTTTYPPLPSKASTGLYPDQPTNPDPPRTRSAPLLQPGPSAPDLQPSTRRPGLGDQRVSYSSSNDSSLESTIYQDDEEEDEEEIVSPAFPEYPANVMICQPSSNRTDHLAHAQHLLSSSLPASLYRSHQQPTSIQGDCIVTQEFLKITQQLRDGLLSPERLTPASRIKQVGIGGRGRRHVSTSTAQAASGRSKSPQDARFPEPRFAQSFHEPVILRAPRAIRAWERF